MPSAQEVTEPGRDGRSVERLGPVSRPLITVRSHAQRALQRLGVVADTRVVHVRHDAVLEAPAVPGPAVDIPVAQPDQHRLVVAHDLRVAGDQAAGDVGVAVVEPHHVPVTDMIRRPERVESPLVGPQDLVHPGRREHSVVRAQGGIVGEEPADAVQVAFVHDEAVENDQVFDVGLVLDPPEPSLESASGHGDLPFLSCRRHFPARSPRNAFTTSGCLRISAADPASVRCPRSITTADLATRSAAMAFCSTIRTPMPVLEMSAIASMTASTTTGARPMDGSSMRITLGADIMARPSASICCSPPLSSPAGWRLRCPRIGNRSSTSLSRCSRRDSECLTYPPSSRFSCTLSGAKTLRPSGTRTRPALATL